MKAGDDVCFLHVSIDCALVVEYCTTLSTRMQKEHTWRFLAAGTFTMGAQQSGVAHALGEHSSRLSHFSTPIALTFAVIAYTSKQQHRTC